MDQEHFAPVPAPLCSPTCDSELLCADADLLLVCGKQNSFPICAADFKPLALGLHHLWTWEREREKETDGKKQDGQLKLLIISYLTITLL